jgi:chromosome segregation ATPase
VACGAGELAQRAQGNLLVIAALSSEVFGIEGKTSAKPIAVVHVDKVPSSDELARKRERSRVLRLKLASEKTALDTCGRKTASVRSELSKLRHLKAELHKSGHSAEEKEVYKAQLDSKIHALEADLVKLNGAATSIQDEIRALIAEIN